MKRVKPSERIVQKSIGLKYRHIQFFDEHPEFDVNKMVRDNIDKQIAIIDSQFSEVKEEE